MEALLLADKAAADQLLKFDDYGNAIARYLSA